MRITYKCFAAHLPGKDAGECSGRLDPHHVLSQQRIKKELGVEKHYLADRRNIVPLCRFHHAQFHDGPLRFKRHELPSSVEEFAREFGLEWALDHAYGRRP